MKRIVQLQSLAETPDRLSAMVENLPPKAIFWCPSDADWSVHLVLGHLYHCEPLFRARLERITTEDNPWLAYFGPKEAPPECDLDMPELLENFRAERMETLAALYALAPHDWSRPAHHETMGPTSLFGQVRNILNHDTEHTGQIHDVITRWHESTPGDGQAHPGESHEATHRRMP